MKTLKTLIASICLVSMISGHLFAQSGANDQPSNTYSNKTWPKEKTRKFLVRYMSAMDTVKSDDVSEKILLGFVQVAEVSKYDWLTQYQASYYHMLEAVEEKDTVRAGKLLAIAKRYIDLADSIQKDESEIVLLKALINGIAIGLDPSLGKTLGPEVMKGYERAKKLNPENPRVYLATGESYLYMPEAMGGGKKQAKEYFELALKKYANDKHDDAAWPVWGKDRAASLLKKASE